jgi:hypothetical protein
MEVFKPEFLAILNELEEAAFMKGNRAASYSNYLVGSDRYKQNDEEFRQFSSDVENAKRRLKELTFKNKG